MDERSLPAEVWCYGCVMCILKVPKHDAFNRSFNRLTPATPYH
jgi:hypothetical protein